MSSLFDSIKEHSNQLEKLKKVLSNKKLPLSDKVKMIIQFKAELFSILWKSMENNRIDSKRASIIDKLLKAISSLEDSVYRQANYELNEEIDFLHPKIQKAFLIYFERVITALEEEGFLDKKRKGEYIAKVAERMRGFEEEMQEYLNEEGKAILNQNQEKKI